MKKRTLIFALIAVILLAIFITSLVYNMLLEKKINEQSSGLIYRKTYLAKASVEGTNILGFDITTEFLNFGTIPREGIGKRHVILENNKSFPMYVVISAEGELADWISTKSNNFILEPSQSMEVNLTVFVPPDAENRAYFANVTFSFYNISEYKP